MAAAGKWKLYESAIEYLADGTHDLDDTANWKMALFLSTSNCNTLSTGTGVYGDLTNEHANGNGYTTTFDCDNGVWTASTGSIVARFAVIYRNATVNTIVKPLLCVSLLDTAPANVTATDGNTFTVAINASGVLTLTGGTAD
jgi:hypothetical protein